MKLRNIVQLFNRLQSLGFTFEEAEKLRRIEMTLHRWDEAECGNSGSTSSWCIERDEQTGKPFHVVYPNNGAQIYRRSIADREAGALKRLAGIMARHSELVAYHQGDCRGCALYIVRKSDIPAGANLNSCYTVGVAVAA